MKNSRYFIPQQILTKADLDHLLRGNFLVIKQFPERAPRWRYVLKIKELR